LHPDSLGVFTGEYKSQGFKPTVDRRILFLLSGITWSIVGIMLCNTALGWLDLKGKGFLFVFVGLLVSVFAYFLVFQKLLRWNYPAYITNGGKGMHLCLPGVEELYYNSIYDSSWYLPPSSTGP